MALFTMTFDSAPIDRLPARVASRLPQANARALNRTGTTVRAFMSRDIAKDMGMKVGDVKERIGLTRATAARQAVQIAVTGKRIPLIDLGARGPYPSRGQGRGVTAIVGGVRKTYPQAFIAKMKTGHIGVFQRRSRARLPIHELRGASLPHVFSKLTPGAIALGRSEYLKNLAHETRFVLRSLAS